MIEKCEIVHKRKGELVIKLDQCVKIQAKVFDSNDKNIGKIIRIFGPVSKPYGLVKIDKLEDEKLERVLVKC